MEYKPRKNRPRPISAKKLDAAFAPLALEIGQLNRAWNRLHENLGKIFAAILNRNVATVPLAVWYSVTNDRSQRLMLSAASKAFFAFDTATHPKAKDDIKWLLKECDALAGQRNTAIHAPLILTRQDGSKDIKIASEYFFGNPLAASLKDKNLFDEMLWYRARAEILQNHALSIWMHFGQRESWPEKPLMPTPTRGQTRRK